ncbi:MAG TPA: glycosyltransferase [Pyrinomonadaceae bacterium]|nr:glycosyltransferase [Pyrinomonadaceae bacterium]
MKFLFSSYPLFGHLLPMLPLAAAARSTGHEVVIASGGEVIGSVERYGFDVWRVEDQGTETTLGAGQFIPGLPADESARRRAPELVSRAESWKPDVVVHEPLDFAAPIAAARTGARHLVHALGPMIPRMMYDFLAPGVDRLYAEWGLPGLSTPSDATYLDICPPSLQSDGPSLWERIQPLRPGTFAGAEEESLPASISTSGEDGFIHVTLGTVVNKSIETFNAVLDGLRDTNRIVVLTVGPDVDPSVIERQSTNVIVESFVPHALLLPRCSLVINHAGNGSVFAALSYGLPLLLLPRGADQFTTAAACARAGVAIALRPSDVTPENVRAAVDRLLTQPSFSENARRLQLEILNMPLAEEFVRSL